MDCPHCRSGPLRVLPNVSIVCPHIESRPECHCDHRLIVCEKCLSFMLVECGPPFGENKLPPEHKVNVFKTWSTPGAPLTPEQEEFQLKLKAYYPTLEEFKLKLKSNKKNTAH